MQQKELYGKANKMSPAQMSFWPKGIEFPAKLSFWPNFLRPNCHSGQIVTSQIVTGQNVFLAKMSPAKLCLAKLSQWPNCLWPNCLSGQNVTSQIVTSQIVSGQIMTGQIVSGQTVFGQIVFVAKLTQPNCTWPNCQSGQIVNQPRNGHLAVYDSWYGLKNKKDLHFLSGATQRLAPSHKIDTRGRIPLSALVLWVLPSHLSRCPELWKLWEIQHRVGWIRNPEGVFKTFIPI